MTKKDYEFFAKLFKGEHLKIDSGTTVFSIVIVMSKYFYEDNPRFDVVRFLTACDWDAKDIDNWKDYIQGYSMDEEDGLRAQLNT